MLSARTYVTVVSGMPRSGTSLMMRMLDAGGIPALTDGRRPADLHNPHGYFEDERARSLAHDASWIGEAVGKAVKIIYRLLSKLPAHLEYRVVMMERDVDEVFDSQQDMLLSSQHAAAGQDRGRMTQALAADLGSVIRWVALQPNIHHLVVPYRGLIGDTRYWTALVSQFLGSGLDEDAMGSVVDPALYRHRR